MELIPGLRAESLHDWIEAIYVAIAIVNYFGYFRSYFCWTVGSCCKKINAAPKLFEVINVDVDLWFPWVFVQFSPLQEGSFRAFYIEVDLEVSFVPTNT